MLIVADGFTTSAKEIVLNLVELDSSFDMRMQFPNSFGLSESEPSKTVVP